MRSYDKFAPWGVFAPGGTLHRGVGGGGVGREGEGLGATWI